MGVVQEAIDKADAAVRHHITFQPHFKPYITVEDHDFVVFALTTLAMAAVASRAPPNLQPRPKATATSNTCTQSAIAATRTPILRSSTPVSQTSSRQLSNDLLSEKATTSLIRRTLCTTAADKTAPISELLPPLTSSNDVDLELYAFIAIVMKEFIYSWYAKITPDQVFVEELVRIIAHCTRALEQRLRKIDLEALILDELPELIDAHARGQSLHSSGCELVSPRILLLTLNCSLWDSFMPFTSLTTCHRSSGHLSFALATSCIISGS